MARTELRGRTGGVTTVMATATAAPRHARRIHVRGIVQGVGFRPDVYRLAHAHALDGWVANDSEGVRIHVEGGADRLEAFASALVAAPPPAARISTIEVQDVPAGSLDGFEIRSSDPDRLPATDVSPDLAVCDDCLDELFDRSDARFGYPYINCTNCGPRFSIVSALPYDRASTTMASWALCEACSAEYHDSLNRRFHAQPVACPICGPQYRLAEREGAEIRGCEAIDRAARLLAGGRIVAVKGIGGYHLACDAANPAAEAVLRDRKFRKEQAFALMVRDECVARSTAELTDDARRLLSSSARPIVVAPARIALDGVAPENPNLGVMLPYAPLHHLLFAAGAPDRMVMTSANRSSEPIAFEDDDARERLAGLADAFLVGERPIARRVDDSVVRAGVLGPMVLRRSRGLAPAPVGNIRAREPVLAVGGDLKNTITLAVDGRAYVSQHIGDLSHYASRRAFEQTVADLLAMYRVGDGDFTLAYDAHPQYVSSQHAAALPARRAVAVQHHRAHVASVLAERGAIGRRVLGIAFDGTGYGDDGSIWGGEFFVGSIEEGFDRVAHLTPAVLPGGDAAARHPVQAAAGFLCQLPDAVDVSGPPFNFPRRYRQSVAIARSGVRAFPTTSVGRLFDAVAALLGFTRSITFEGQAAMWLEYTARAAIDAAELPWRFTGTEIDWKEALRRVVEERKRGTAIATIARGFHRGLARATADAVEGLLPPGCDTVVLSGGVMQNDLLLSDLKERLAPAGVQLWVNREVPPNDGGLSLGQAAIAAPR